MDNLCIKCQMDNVFLDGLCEDCYEEQFEDEKKDIAHDKMLVHGANLKNQPFQNRGIDKLNKLKRK